MDYREKLLDLGLEISRIKTVGKTVCPKCSHTRKKKTDPCLTVNVEEGWYKCHNGGCDFSGNVKFDNGPKVYSRPTLINQTECHESVLQWFQNRCINQATIIKNRVKSCYTKMSRDGSEEHCIAFNYYRNGEPINVKYRTHDKRFKLEKNAEMIFYGLDDLKDTHEYILIAEGEICKLSWNESGVDFALSVPNGTSLSSKQTLEYVDNSQEYFKNSKKIILATDNDNAGMILREELSRRFGKSRCYKIDFQDCKDANDYLVKYGPQKLADLIKKENLIEYPINGIVNISSIREEVYNISVNGLPKGVTTRIFPELDNIISFSEGKFGVVTGAPNAGKSPFVDQVMLSLSIIHGWKWGVCSMESKPLAHYVSLYLEKVIGRTNSAKRPISPEEMDRAFNFIENHFFFIEANTDNDERDTVEFILGTIEDLVKKKGINGYVIDPWNKIEHSFRKGENETNYVSRVLDDMIRCCQKNSVLGMLIAHPSKMTKNKMGEYDVPDLYSISGSSNFYNKPDFGITVHRNHRSGLTEVHVNKMKWKHLGQLGAVALRYNPVNGRLGDPNKKLDFSNWLDSLIFLPSTNIESAQVVDIDHLDDTGKVLEDAPF